MWNANPLREVVPIDWAEITRALRTVWLHSLRKPEQACFGRRAEPELWRSAIDVWNEAGQAGWPAQHQGHPSGAATPPARQAVRRAGMAQQPDLSHAQGAVPAGLGLAAQAGPGVEGMDEAERQRLDFHLRQFVDAMSPSLLLVSNPAALRRAMETGGASLAEGARTC